MLPVRLTVSPSRMPASRAQKHRADIVFFQVQRHALNAAGELQQFPDHAVFQAINAGDAVTDLQDGSHADFLRHRTL